MDIDILNKALSVIPKWVNEEEGVTFNIFYSKLNTIYIAGIITESDARGLLDKFSKDLKIERLSYDSKEERYRQCKDISNY